MWILARCQCWATVYPLGSSLRAITPAQQHQQISPEVHCISVHSFVVRLEHEHIGNQHCP